MKRFLAGVACATVFGMAGSAWAYPVTLVDVTDFTATGTVDAGDYISHGGGDVNVIGDNFTGGVIQVPQPDWVQWKHHFTFDPDMVAINSATITFEFDDDSDTGPEYGFGWQGNWSWNINDIVTGYGSDWDFGEIDPATYTYNVNLSNIVISNLINGELKITIGNGGLTDFSIVKSTLVIEYDLVPVPEPGTMLIFGAGVLGIAGVIRRKK